mgnify:CR=1 FL=1
MKITDIIRGILDLTDAAMATQQAQEPEPVAVIELAPEMDSGADELAIIQQLAGIDSDKEPEYQNTPNELVKPIGASFPGGDDVHQRKNPADIRTNAPSMYPGFQAEKRQ